MHTQVAPSGEHEYNLRLTFRLSVRDRLLCLISGILLPFLYICVN